MKINRELGDTRFVGKDISLNLINWYSWWWFLSELLVIIIVVNIVAYSDEFLAQIRAGQE